MREVIWSLNSENDSLENLLSYLNRRGKEMFAHSTIHFRAKSSKDIRHIALKGEQRKHIFLTVMEAMHNSLKHADATLVELKLSLVENKLIVVIQDDGIGFNAEFVHHGNGLRNMQERLLNVNGQFLIEATNGTKISMEIPLA